MMDKQERGGDFLFVCSLFFVCLFFQEGGSRK